MKQQLPFDLPQSVDKEIRFKDLRIENDKLRAENDKLRAENDKLNHEWLLRTCLSYKLADRLGMGYSGVMKEAGNIKAEDWDKYMSSWDENGVENTWFST